MKAIMKWNRLVGDDLIGGVLYIPLGDEFIAGLADVLVVDDGASETRWLL